MWIIREPKKAALWNKRHFEDKNGECAACLKYSVLIFVEKKLYKMQHLEGSGTAILYIGHTVLKDKYIQIQNRMLHDRRIREVTETACTYIELLLLA